MREALRGLLLANNSGEPPPPSCLETLNEQSAEAAVVLRFDGDGAALVTRCGGVDSAIARLLAIVHGAMNDRTWRRLKACPAEDCHVGLLRPLAQPLRDLVRDGRVRQPGQGPSLARAPQAARAPER